MSNLCQIVDEQDNIIGSKPRNEIDFKNDYFRISGLWLTNSHGQVLIAQRHLTKDKDPGLWAPAAAGTLEVGETYESNIYKEAEEEIGLSGITFAVGPKMKFDEPRKDEFVLQLSEVEQVKWIDKYDLVKDVTHTPDKYVPSMARIINEFV
jgi:isopentenyldiphosphate isomerase